MNEEFTVNFNGINSYMVNNEKKMISFFKDGYDLPIIINVDNDLALADEVLRRQKEDPKYQGTNSEEITKAILEDMAREQESFQEVKTIEGYDTTHISDIPKLKKISALLKEADKENYLLPEDEQFSFIDEENNCIMSKTGKVLEAVTIDGVLVVRTPEGSIKFKDEELSQENTLDGNMETQAYVTPINDEDISDKEIDEVYEELFADTISDEEKEEIMASLKQMRDDPDKFFETHQSQKFYDAYSLYNEKKELSKQKTMRLVNKDIQQAGSSNGLLIAIIVLFIVFAVFMYIVFRR